MIITCVNNGISKRYSPGTNLYHIANDMKVDSGAPIIAALSNNMLKELWCPLYSPHTVEFITIAHPEGMRTYQRSLAFVLQKAVKELFPQTTLVIEHSVSNGWYCELHGIDDLSTTMVAQLADKMHELIKSNLHFDKTKLPTNEAMAIFEQEGLAEKALLQYTRGNFYTSVYYLDGYGDHFYGPLVPSTGYLQNFGLVPYYQGMLLMFPRRDKPSELEDIIIQKKMFDIFQEHTDWVEVIGGRTVGDLNQTIQQGQAAELIRVSETLHERKYAQITEMIYARGHQVKIVLIAGPSSSGKTTTSKRLSTQLRVSGFIPKVIELDNYFLDREHTPRDEHGEYDFESIHALDLPLFNQHLEQLLNGEEVELPRFNFKEGKREYKGHKMQLHEKDILVMEGIHALNPELAASIDDVHKFRIYASALTSVNLDSNNRISTTDNRLLRRLVRDARTRGVDAVSTLNRWQSVRRGEDRNIFPYQENADVMFNSSLPYELHILRKYAEPHLRQVPENNPAYTDAVRLLKFLSYFSPIDLDAENHIPSISVIREFIGGSGFKYD